MGPRGDAILEFDWSVGEIAGALRRLGLERNTLFIVTSDNGPVVDDGYRDDAAEKLTGHRPAGPLRGGKYSAFEGGTRVPFALAGVQLSERDAPDSHDSLRTLLGASTTGRDHVVEHAGTLALVRGDWKYIQPAKGQAIDRNTGIELGNDPSPQLYNLKTDPGERRNVAAEHANVVKELSALLQKIRNEGRSRP
jgi:arylsulfatase A-like enzyme